MKQFILDLLAEKSAISSMRFLAITSLGIAAAIAFYALYAGKDLLGTAELCGVFVSAAFAGKVTQKYVESKTPSEPK